MGPSTDGVNVAYGGYNAFWEAEALFLVRPGGDEVLGTGHFRRGIGFGAPSALLLENGGVAWRESENDFSTSTPLFRRSPAGAEEQLTPGGTISRMEAMGPDGTVVYQRLAARADFTGTRFIHAPGGTLRDLGSGAPGERVVVRDGRFLLLSGGAVFLLTE